jgi:hypothetical protein
MKILDAKIGDIITYNNPKHNEFWVGCKFKVLKIDSDEYYLECVYVTEKHKLFTGLRTEVGKKDRLYKNRFLQPVTKNHLPKWF